MPIVLDDIRTHVADSIKLAIGSQLSQGYNQERDTTEGIVLAARPNPEQAIPPYPYAVIDILGIEDTEFYLTNLSYDEDTGEWVYETHKDIDIQVTVFGGDATDIANDLATSYRRDEVREVLRSSDVSLISVDAVTINPELLQTDFLEVGVVRMKLGVNDCYRDGSLGVIEDAIVNGQLECTISGNPLLINIDTTN